MNCAAGSPANYSVFSYGRRGASRLRLPPVVSVLKTCLSSYPQTRYPRSSAADVIMSATPIDYDNFYEKKPTSDTVWRKSVM
jgi:hypothetical protein